MDVRKNITIGLVVPFAQDKVPEEGPLMYPGVRFIPVIPRSVSRSAFDWTGAFLTTAGVGVLTFGIIEGPSHGWGSALILGAFIVGFCALAAFVAWERRHESPLIDVSLFSRAPFTSAHLSIPVRRSVQSPSWSIFDFSTRLRSKWA